MKFLLWVAFSSGLTLQLSDLSVPSEWELREADYRRNAHNACRTWSKERFQADRLARLPPSQVFEFTAKITPSDVTSQFLNQSGPWENAEWHYSMSSIGWWLFYVVAAELLLWTSCITYMILKRWCCRKRMKSKASPINNATLPRPNFLIFLGVFVVSILGISGITAVTRFGNSIIYNSAASPCTLMTASHDLLFETSQALFPRFQGVQALNQTLEAAESRAAATAAFVAASQVDGTTLSQFMVEGILESYLWTDYMLNQQLYTGWQSANGSEVPFTLGLLLPKAERLRQVFGVSNSGTSLATLSTLLGVQGVEHFGLKPSAAVGALEDIQSATSNARKALQAYTLQVIKIRDKFLDPSQVWNRIRSIHHWIFALRFADHLFTLSLIIGISIYIHYLLGSVSESYTPPRGIRIFAYSATLAGWIYLAMAALAFWGVYFATDICKTVEDEFITNARYGEHTLTNGLDPAIVDECLAPRGSGDLLFASGWTPDIVEALNTSNWDLRAPLNLHLSDSMDLREVQRVLADRNDAGSVKCTCDRVKWFTYGLINSELERLTNDINALITTDDYPYRFCITPSSCPQTIQDKEVVFLTADTVYNFDPNRRPGVSPIELAAEMGRDERVRNAFPTDPSRAHMLAEALHQGVLRNIALSPLIRHWDPNIRTPFSYFDPCPIGAACPIFFSPLDARYPDPLVPKLQASPLLSFSSWREAVLGDKSPSLLHIRTVEQAVQSMTRQLAFINPSVTMTKSIDLNTRRFPCSFARDQLLRVHNRLCHGVGYDLTALAWGWWALSISSILALVLCEPLVRVRRTQEDKRKHTLMSQNELLMLRSSERGDLELMKRLVTLGVAPDAICDSDGNTPLHLAAYYGQSHCVAFLRSRGCDSRSTNKLGHTPLSLARMNPDVTEKRRKETLGALESAFHGD